MNLARRLVRPGIGALTNIAAALLLMGAHAVHAQSNEEPAESLTRVEAPYPRIGLVLSGGGARGAAHIGVLKVLEELRVPIHAVAGTSMGAVVGGLYASGLSASEIESVMTSVNWQDAFRDTPPRTELSFRRKLEDRNYLVKFPLGVRSRRILLPRGLIQGQKLNLMLRELTLPVSQIDNFDALPTPFRAVATDLVTGERVVIDDGDLTTAMRASLSAPGVFAPVEWDGQLLVDGGISENLPIDVAREMGVDVLIVVDVGFPLYPRDKLSSAPVVSNQMLAILIRRDSQRQRATLSDADIVIDPPLGDASSFDFGIVRRAMYAGEGAARDAQAKLLTLALDPQQYERYVANRREVRDNRPKIEFVRVEPGSERYAHSLKTLFGEFVSHSLDADAVSDRVTDFYGRGYLERLDYELVEDSLGRTGLALSARRNSWGPNYIRFGLNLQDDFEGNSSYNAATRLLLSEITEAGGEWVWDFQIGESPRVATEVYLPVSQTSGYFFLPQASYDARNVPVLGDEDQEQLRLAEFRLRTFRYGLDFGREFGNWGEIRTGLFREDGEERVRVGDPLQPTTRFDAEGYFVRMTYDGVDDIDFPREGNLASLEWRHERSERQRSDLPGQTLSDKTDRLVFDWIAAQTFGRYTGVFWTSAGTTLNGANIDPIDPVTGQDLTDVRTLFTLGGFFNLSGLKADSISGPHFGIARFLFYRQIGRAGPGFLNVPTYLGMSYEVGNVWDDRSEISLGSARKDVSVWLGLDTLIGPLYLGSGFEEGGKEAFYLFLGRTF